MNADRDEAKAAQRQAKAFHSNIEKACRILGSQTDATRKQVARAASRVERLKTGKSSGRYGTLTKPQKAAASKLAQALRQLEIALKNPNLADDMRPSFGLDEDGFELVEVEVELERWRARAEAAAYKELRKQNPPHHAKFHAAEEAAKLLKDHGRPMPLTRKGPYCKLAAILFGDQIDFLYHCRAVKTKLSNLENSTTKPNPT